MRHISIENVPSIVEQLHQELYDLPKNKLAEKLV